MRETVVIVVPGAAPEFLCDENCGSGDDYASLPRH
jgi:hypothetical protein